MALHTLARRPDEAGAQHGMMPLGGYEGLAVGVIERAVYDMRRGYYSAAQDVLDGGLDHWFEIAGIDPDATACRAVLAMAMRMKQGRAG